MCTKALKPNVPIFCQHPCSQRSDNIVARRENILLSFFMFSVEPPTNVTFFCHNLHNLLKWSYNQTVPGLRFRVEIRSLERSLPAMLTEYGCSFSLVCNREDSIFVITVLITAETDAPRLFLTCSPPENMWVDPPDLHANISLGTHPSDDIMLSVTAVVGQNESDPAPADGITFSYFGDSLVEQKCEGLMATAAGSRVAESVPAAVV